MKIVACIKYSLDVSEVKVDPATKDIRLAGVPQRVGVIDKHVLETAVALKEASGGTVHGLTLAPAGAREAFREAMAMGLDDLTFIDSDGLAATGPAVTAMVLAAAVQKLGDVNLVVCGDASDDGVSYQIPPRLAERLGWPLLGFARNISLNDSVIGADRDLDSGMQRVEGSLPLVLTVTQETNTPRRPTLMDALKAKKKPVAVWQPEADLNLTPEQLQTRAGVTRTAQTGIVVKRKQQMFQGEDMAALANQLLDALVAERVVAE
jgi:electron transfer flavoprotein beta subunit